MFDAGLKSASDAAVVAAIGGFARQEAQAAASRLAAIAELAGRRCSDDERAHWACDEWDGAAAEVSAALGVTHGRASSEMLMAMSLRHWLPRGGGAVLGGFAQLSGVRGDRRPHRPRQGSRNGRRH